MRILWIHIEERFIGIDESSDNSKNLVRRQARDPFSSNEKKSHVAPAVAPIKRYSSPRPHGEQVRVGRDMKRGRTG